MESLMIDYGKEQIKYTLEFKDVKNINLRIKNGGDVIVSASPKVSLEVVERFVKSKRRWIVKHRSTTRELESNHSIERKYVSGENFIYLGQNYRIKVVESEKEGIEINGQYIFVYVKNKNAEHKRRWLVEGWMRTRVKAELSNAFSNAIEKYAMLVDIPCCMNLRKMKTCWGTCNAEMRKITLNTSLIYAPSYCIEYVILHELCHFRFQNHSKSFYELIENLMPDWKVRKDILDNEVVGHIMEGIL